VCLESKYRVGTTEFENVSKKSFNPKTKTIQILVGAPPREGSSTRKIEKSKNPK